jgi:hypothetical protein
MSKATGRTDRPVSARLHPLVQIAIAALALLYIVAVWFGFAGSGYTDYLLVVVTLFVCGALALPLAAWLVWRRNRRPGAANKNRKPFHDWARSEFDIGQGHITGAAATVEILLPIAAVAFGMAAFAIVALAF